MIQLTDQCLAKNQSTSRNACLEMWYRRKKNENVEKEKCPGVWRTRVLNPDPGCSKHERQKTHAYRSSGYQICPDIYTLAGDLTIWQLARRFKKIFICLYHLNIQRSARSHNYKFNNFISQVYACLCACACAFSSVNRGQSA